MNPISAYEYTPQSCNPNSVGLFYNAHAPLAPSAVTNQFFSPENMLWIQQKLEYMLSQATGQLIRVEINDEFILTMMDMAKRNPGLAYTGNEGVATLNNMVINHEFEVQFLSLRQQGRYKSDVIQLNTPLYYPHPEYTHHKKGELVVDSSGYMLTNPHGNNFDAYNSQVYNIKNGYTKNTILPPSGSVLQPCNISSNVRYM